MIREGSQLRAGALVPCRKVWCESDDPWEREQGVKFPMYCYRFNFPDQHPAPAPTETPEGVLGHVGNGGADAACEKQIDEIKREARGLEDGSDAAASGAAPAAQ